MAKGVVTDVMRTTYDAGNFGGFGPAAAFDVLDLDPAKVRNAESAIKQLNDDVAKAARDSDVRAAIRQDARGVEGMVRFPDATRDMPWRADRPAMAFYDALANDGRLSATVRRDAASAERGVSELVLAHKESSGFAPFGDADYSDAVGPTVHLPTSRKQIDPWANAGVSETDNAFYKKVDQDAMTRVLA
jgi:hypothetical protein